LLGLEGRAQASGLEWIRTAGGLRDDGLQFVAAGSNGVVFATGVYLQSAEVGG